MQTRTLILLSVGCGLAIMLAGAVFLFQLATQDELSAPLAAGDATEVGDMRVTVAAASETEGGQYIVEVVVGGTIDDDPAGDFRLIAAGRQAPFVETTCAPTDDVDQSCTVSFDASIADGASRVVFYERGDQQARWVLA